MNHCIVHFLMEAQYIVRQVDGVGQQQERSMAGVAFWSTVWEGAAGMGCDIGCIHL